MPFPKTGRPVDNDTMNRIFDTAEAHDVFELTAALVLSANTVGANRASITLTCLMDLARSVTNAPEEKRDVMLADFVEFIKATTNLVKET